MNLNANDWIDLVMVAIIGVAMLVWLSLILRKQSKKIDTINALAQVSYALVAEKDQNTMAINAIRKKPGYDPKKQTEEEKKLLAKNKEIDEKILGISNEIRQIVESVSNSKL